MICSLLFCVLSVSCSGFKTKDNVEITGLSFGYLTESTYNNGNYSEGDITRQADFSSGAVQYMIVDFKLKTLITSTEDQSVKVEIRTSDAFALTLTVQEAPTGKFDVLENDGGSQTYNLFYMIPSNKSEEKAVRMILKLVPNTGGSVDVTVSVFGTDQTSVKGIASETETFRIPSLNLKFTLQDDGTYVATGIGSCTSSQLVIPSIYNGKPVTSVGANEFSDCGKLTGIVMPDSITSIGDKAFYGCRNLTDVVIPDSVTSIGSEAFSACSSLVSVDIPYGVISMGAAAFSDCVSLGSIAIPDSVTNIGSSAFSGCTGLTSMILPFVGNAANGTSNTHFGYIFGADSYSDNDTYVPTSIKTVIITGDVNMGEGAFYNCLNLTGITLSDDVTSIGDFAFYGCSALTSMTVPDGVSTIGSAVFKGCKNLKSITIGNGITSIGEEAFSYCEGLTSMTIGNEVTSIGFSAFYGCNGLTGITLPFAGNTANGTKNMHFGYIFGANSYSDNGSYVPTSLKTVVITNSNIGSSAFYGCSTLTNVMIGNGVTSIGSSAFAGCVGLKTVEIPDGVTSIGFGAFSDCKNLTSMTLPFVGNTVTSNQHLGYIFGTSYYSESARHVPASLTMVSVTGGENIGMGAFYGCSGLTSVVLPDSVTSIGSSAFFGCSSLNGINIPSGVTSIGKSAFSGCTALTLKELPESVVSIGDSAFSGCIGLTFTKLPESLTSIGSSAFYDCTGLTSIYVPDGVKSIGLGAFQGCSGLTSMTLPFVGKNETSNQHLGYIFGAVYCSDNARYVPSSLMIISITGGTNIGTGAFSGCNNLMGISIPACVTSIGNSAFSGCSLLLSANIPNGVTSIGNSAFSGCSNLLLREIPDSVQSIGKSAFSGCVSLTLTKLPDSLTSVGESAFSDCTGMKTLVIPDSVKSIGLGAFSGCQNLTSMTLPFVGKTATSNQHLGYIFGASYYSDNARYVPSSLTAISVTGGETIGTGAFYGCDSLTGVVLPDSITSIGKSAFSGCRSLTFKALPDSVTSVGDSAFRYCESLALMKLPNGLTSIGASAFSDCSRLTTIEIPGNVTSIGSSAFSGCIGLTTVEIPDSVKSIGFGAFSGCSGLTSMTLPFVGNTAKNNQYLGYIFGASYYSDSVRYLPSSLTTISVTGGETIGTGAFYGCNSLTSILLPDSIKSIGSSAFYDCGLLTIINIPNGMISVGKFAFSGCRSLTEIRFNGKIAQWEAVSFGSSWNSNTGNFTITCSNGALSKDGTILFR